jgi:hypothetical protein
MTVPLVAAALFGGNIDKTRLCSSMMSMATRVQHYQQEPS